MSFWSGFNATQPTQPRAITPEDFGRFSLVKSFDTKALSPWRQMFSFNPQLDNQAASKALVTAVAPGLPAIAQGIKTGDFSQYNQQSKQYLKEKTTPAGILSMLPGGEEGPLKKAGDAIKGVVGKIPKVIAKQERGFVTSVKETAPALENRVSGQYVPRSTDELAIKAKNLIATDINTAEKLARTGSSDKAVATASELVKKYTDDAEIATDDAIKNTLYDKAATIANDAARNLTEQGRAVQAASILGRLTPEGMARFAAREIQKFNEGAPIAKRIPELSPQQLQDIVSRMKEIAGMPDGIEKSKAFREVQDYVSRLTPSPLYAKLITVWKAGLLTGIKTSGLNTASNLFHGVSEIAKDIPAAAVDSVASLFTGKRTLALTTKGTGGGLKEGLQKGWDYLTTGYDARDTALKLDYNKVHFGDSMFAKAIQKYEETVFHVLGAEDQPFYYGAKARSIASQAIAEAKNQGLKGADKAKFVDDMLQNPTDDILRNATADAEMAVFQNSTVLGRIAKSIQNVPGGEVVVPFGRTPAAVATQLINYSPVGIVKTIGEQIANKKFDQRLFSQGIGRAVTGTGALWLGTQLFKHDMISLGYPTDERTQKLWDLEGRKANTIKVFGKWRAVSSLGPLGYALVVGGYFAQGVKENGGIFSGLENAAAGAGKSLTDQTFLRGVDQLVKAISDPVNSAGAYFKGLIGSLVPTIVSDVARATDKKERRTPDVTDTMQSRIPGLREKLQPQVNTFGQEVKTPGFFTTMLDPTRPSIASNDPVVTELRRLAEVGYKITPTQLGDKNGYPVLTESQNTKLWEDSGSLLKSKLDRLIAAPEYQNASDEEKSNLIEDFTTKTKVIARASMVLELTHGLSGQALKDALAKLKAGKLLTQDVFKKYLELR